MQTREEFIDAHWEEALVIDAKMREAAIACVKNFLGEDHEIPTRISRENWAKYDSALDYFVLLAYTYALSALGERKLKRRTFVESLFQLVILQSAIGNECVTVVAREEGHFLTMGKALAVNKLSGNDRVQAGLGLVRMIYGLFKYLPKNLSELEVTSKSVPIKTAKRLWIAVKSPSLSHEKRSESSEREAEEIQMEVARICNAWNLQRGSSMDMDMDGWMLEEIES